MKVLFFNYEYPPLGGGAANATEYLLREYAKIPELAVDLVTSSIDEEYHLESISPKIRIHKLPIGKNASNLHFQSKMDLIRYTWKAYWFGRKLAKKEKFDLTHSFFTVPCGFLSLLIKWEFQLPFVVSLRGSDVPGYSDRFKSLYKIITPLITFIWARADSVIANSEGLRALALESWKEEKIGVIYNGVDIEHFHPIDRNNHPAFVITPGASRITRRKGLNFLIEAVGSLFKNHPDLSVMILGEGDAKNELVAQAKDLGLDKQVEFPGRIPKDETAPFYQAADVFVLPSLNEGMSNAMLEALASGLPIIATDTGGTKELVREEENGFIVPMKSSAALAEKIEWLLNHPQERKKMGDASRLQAEKMSWAVVAKQYHDLYSNLAVKKYEKKAA